MNCFLRGQTMLRSSSAKLQSIFPRNTCYQNRQGQVLGITSDTPVALPAQPWNINQMPLYRVSEYNISMAVWQTPTPNHPQTRLQQWQKLYTFKQTGVSSDVRELTDHYFIIFRLNLQSFILLFILQPVSTLLRPPACPQISTRFKTYKIKYNPRQKSMASMRNTYEKPSVKDRISQLYQKINTIEPKQHQSKKKYEAIQMMCDQLEEQVHQFMLQVDEKLVDIKHKNNKINKEIKKNYDTLDAVVREQIKNSNQRIMMLFNQQSEIAQENSSSILHYVEQQTSRIHSEIEKEELEREEEGRAIEESLAADIGQITRVLEEMSTKFEEKMKKLESSLSARTYNLSTKLHEICSTYSDNEAEFYKMLRDLVKKVKSELSEHQQKREETEAEILNLIDKMCDSRLAKRS